MYSIQHLGSIPFQSDNTGSRDRSAEQKKGPNPDKKNANFEHWIGIFSKTDHSPQFSKKHTKIAE
jgi:hypothetical protein